MQQKVLQRSLASVIILALIGFGVFSLRMLNVAHASLSAGPDVVIPNQTAPLLKHARMVGSTRGNQTLNLSISLALRNHSDLTSLLSSMYDPHAVNYHQYLTAQDFTNRFAPTASQQQQVLTFLSSKGLHVTSVAPNGLLIDVQTTVAQAQQVFKIKINNYQLGKKAFYANASAPTIPASLSSIILSIGGLDSSVHYRPLADAHNLSAQKQATVPSGGYTPSNLHGAYSVIPGYQGIGQTVGVFELDGYNSNDVTQYLQRYNLGSPSMNRVLVDGYNGSANGGAIEAELDMEVVAAMAPKASQLVYEGPNTTQGVNDTYNKMVTDNKVQVITTSWGLCEAASGNPELQTLDNIFAQGAAEGMSIYAASGDSGAYDCGDGNLAVDSPADDPYVTGVGGTNLQVNGSAYSSESVWSNPADTSRGTMGAGSGGGLSSYFKQPGWQKGPGVQNSSNSNREVPDVSADADPNTGYAVYCTVAASGCPSSGWIMVGGTSAAAPLWAASTATINNFLAAQGKPRMGYANPVLYNLENATQTYPAFHDVSSGNNLYYPATANYDMASGWGSPNIYNIARDLLGSNAPIPTPVPTAPAPTPTPQAGNLILNGGFESGKTNWVESSANGFELVDTSNPYTGTHEAFLCGYNNCRDTIYQTVTIPATATSATLTYHWYVTTAETAHPHDYLNVDVRDGSSNVLGTVQTISDGSPTGSWQSATYDVSAYAGKSVQIAFVATSDASNQTNFYVDDVALVAN